MKDQSNRVFVTGGTGYIGSHTCVELLARGYDVTVFDNLSNSNREVLNRLARITGKTVHFVKGDIRDKTALRQAMAYGSPKKVIHFAGLKAVGESVEHPLRYYDNNVAGSLCLLEVMNELGIRSLVFSSSATVYGVPETLPYTETHRLAAINPYGTTKLTVENILRDLCRSDPHWRVGILRYFNPVGAHASGLIGEDPRGIPNNLMPFIAQVAGGRRPHLNIWGDDYATPDGTGVRDYVHVTDLAIGHVMALDHVGGACGCFAVNIGTGQGHSVMDMVRAFESACGHTIALKVGPRRDGDLPAYFANATLARTLLDWQAERDLDTMCRDTWNWQVKNPNGYES